VYQQMYQNTNTGTNPWVFYSVPWSFIIPRSKLQLLLDPK